MKNKNIIDKKKLYESIMKNVAVLVKKAINENTALINMDNDIEFNKSNLTTTAKLRTYESIIKECGPSYPNIHKFDTPVKNIIDYNSNVDFIIIDPYGTIYLFSTDELKKYVNELNMFINDIEENDRYDEFDIDEINDLRNMTEELLECPPGKWKTLSGPSVKNDLENPEFYVNVRGYRYR